MPGICWKRSPEVILNNLVLDYLISRFRKEYPAYSFLWRHERDAHGDIEADMPILEAFGVPAERAREFVRSTRPLREQAASLLGEKMIVGSHTPESTERYYRQTLDKAEKAGGGRIEDFRIEGWKDRPAISCFSITRCSPKVDGRIVRDSLQGLKP